MQEFNIGNNMFACLSENEEELIIADFYGNCDCILKATANKSNYGLPYPITIGSGFILALEKINNINNKIDELEKKNNELHDIIENMVKAYGEAINARNI